jgi:hypothetical protein
MSASQRARRFARLAQIPFGFAQGKLSRRKERWLGMTIKLSSATFYSISKLK